MKTTSFIALALLAGAVSCTEPQDTERAKQPSPSAVDTTVLHESSLAVGAQPLGGGLEDRLPPGYSLRDTVQYNTQVMGSTRALLYRDSLLLDTVDYYFGAAPVGCDSVVVWPVRTESRAEGTAGPTVFTLLTLTDRITLSKQLPYLDDYFSSPHVINRRLYYWGLAPAKEQYWNRILAMRYDFRRQRLDSCYLYTGILDTDNWGVLERPYLSNSRVVFVDPRFVKPHTDRHWEFPEGQFPSNRQVKLVPTTE